MSTEMQQDDVRARALTLLREVRSVLESEGGRNWLPGITSAIGALDRQASTSGELDEGLREAASIYRSMNRGPGSFGDFYVQRADPVEQARANERYGRLVDELWFLLEPIR